MRPALTLVCAAIVLQGLIFQSCFALITKNGCICAPSSPCEARGGSPEPWCMIEGTCATSFGDGWDHCRIQKAPPPQAPPKAPPPLMGGPPPVWTPSPPAASENVDPPRFRNPSDGVAVVAPRADVESSTASSASETSSNLKRVQLLLLVGGAACAGCLVLVWRRGSRAQSAREDARNAFKRAESMRRSAALYATTRLGAARGRGKGDVETIESSLNASGDLDVDLV